MRISPAVTPATPCVEGERTGLTNVGNSSGRVGGWTDDGASGNDRDAVISWRCVSGEFEPSSCNCRAKSVKGRTWHKTVPADNKIKEMSRIDADRVT